jgi:hypothetical protein
VKTIIIKTNFNHASQPYWKGERRIVPDSDAGYFCGVGWAVEEGRDGDTSSDTAHKTLEVQHGQLGQAANTLGESDHG